MIRPPVLLHLRITRRDGRPLDLWLPLFLLWPIALALAIVILPFWLLAALAWRISGRSANPWVVPWRLVVLICCLPGVSMEICESGERAFCIALW